MSPSPEGWQEVSLGEICEFRYGKSLPEKARQSGRIPVFGSNGIIGHHHEAITTGPTIVVGRKGSFGEVCYSESPCWPIDTTYYVDGTATKADLRWLSYRLAALGLNQMNRAAAVPGLNREDAYQKRLLLPPVPEQRRIAAILDKADELRARRRVIEDLLSGMPDALFSELEQSPDFGLWTKVSLRAAFWFQEGPGVRSSQFRPEGVKLLNVGNIEKNGRLNLGKTKRFISEEEFKTKYRHFAVDEGDFVIASSGISFDDDGFLRTRGAFVQVHHLPLCMNTSTIRFKAVKDKSNLRFLSGWLNSLSFRSQITRLVTGSAQQNFGPSHLEAVRITLPPLHVQESLANQFLAIDRLRESQRSSLATMGELFSSLQHQAFNGAL